CAKKYGGSYYYSHYDNW
nr:immunoglobulin heavy chain junction region [Macaca mulatta]